MSTEHRRSTEQGELYARVEYLLEWPMMLLAVLFIAAAIVQGVSTIPAQYRTIAQIGGWVIWAAFAAEYVVLLVLARRRWLYVRTHIIDLLIVVLPALRVFRVLRALRLLRFLRFARLATALALLARQWREIGRIGQRRGVTFVLLGVVLMLFVGAQFMHSIEGATNEGFATYGESLWWALVTATTVGYGDAAPVTLWGRILASSFMIVGVGVFGIISATIAAHFVAADQKEEKELLISRFDVIEKRVVEIGTSLTRLAVFDENEEFYRVDVPKEYSGLSFGEALARFYDEHRAVLVAIEREGHHIMAPTDEVSLAADDVVFLVANRFPPGLKPAG